MSLQRRRLFHRLAAWAGFARLAPAAPQPSSIPQPSPVPPAPARLPGALGGYILSGREEVLHRHFDLVVVGGGISGTCAAISAARNGAKTALVHERSMLGGNSSSEVRLYPEVSTSHNVWCKETGILDEIHTEERRRNHEPYIEGLMNSVWDLVLYEWAVREPNLTLFLNTTAREVEMKDPSTILGVHAIQLGTERKFLFTAPLFIDCSGDGVLGYRAGARFRWGMEARSEFGESQAPPEPSAQPQMGNTLFFRARDAGVPVPFDPPAWAPRFPTEDDLLGRSHSQFEGGYWWIEVGLPHHQIHGNEEIKHEALRQLLGVWDHIKNRCAHRAKAANYGLDFVGFWPYKREARRLVGDHILTQRDIQDPPVHPDSIAFGCWYIDIHKPSGILARSKPNTRPDWEDAAVIPYGIPLRSCYSANVSNLLFAGRPISTSYVAFSSTRVLRTGAIVGQGVGAAAALCLKHACTPRQLASGHAPELRRLLQRQDCFLPGHENDDPLDLARATTASASSHAPLDFPESRDFFPLKTPAAQLFPVSSNRLESVELLLRNETDRPLPITLGLRRAAFVYDFRQTSDVAQATATVPPRSESWVRFDFHCAVEPRSLCWIHLPAVAGLSWARFTDTFDAPARVPAGSTAAELPGPSRWHPLTRGSSFCLRLSPAQFPYGPDNAIRGANRPDRWTNLFVSHPSQSLPAWLELELPRPARLAEVQLTFDTDMNRHSRKPLFVYPDCVSRYDVLLADAAGWTRVARETANSLRRRVHRFEPLATSRVRLEFHATHGAPSARLYEIRLYGA